MGRSNGGSRVIDRDLGWKSMMKQAKEIGKGRKVKVGVLADTSKGKAKPKGSNLNEAEIAAIMEYGAPAAGIPARPALRPTFDKQREQLVKMASVLLSQILVRRTTVPIALNVMGAFLANQTKLYITGGALPGIGPPNEAGYAARKLVRGKARKKYGLEKGAFWLGQKDRAYDKKTGKDVHAPMLVRTWVLTGRLVNSFTWVLEKKGDSK